MTEGEFFLNVISEFDILAHTGPVSHEEAFKKAEFEFEKYRHQLLKEPSPVERHFEGAVKVKALEHTEKKMKKIEGKK